ncbi:MAG: hypothetical protein JSU98_02715 [Gemmatimonadales bacterium]|nr:MAG: hypothetical protein JSU98_02715 [Gemmatimonadales bacterium]
MKHSSPSSSRVGGAVPTPILVLGAILLVAVALRLVASARSGSASHPEPRPAVTAASLLPSVRYAAHPRISQTYDLAREIPQVLDGLYCYCHCSEHSGHRSLLSCFEADHGAGCDICLREAELAHQMHTRGESLEAIRAAVDAAWGV